MDLNTIFFIGPQGSGKGTQAKILAQKLNFFYWEMGGILRSLRSQAETSELAKRVVEQIDAGILLNDATIEEVVRMKLSELPKDQGVIFDGIPRRLGQAEFLFGILKEQGRSAFTTLFVDLPKEESMSRLLLRAATENRADDTREKIEFRLQQYYNDTLPVVDYLRQRTTFFEINGQAGIEAVTEQINHSLQLQ